MLTIFRILILPAWILITISLNNLIKQSTYDYSLFAVFSFLSFFAIISDIFDGYIARKNQNITLLGKILDPLADKLYLVSAGILGIILFGYSKYIFFFLFIRDASIGIITLFIYKKAKDVIVSNICGKLNTIIFSASLLLSTIKGIFPLKQVFLTYINKTISLFFWVLIVTLILSSSTYIVYAINLFKNKFNKKLLISMIVFLLSILNFFLIFIFKLSDLF